MLAAYLHRAPHRWPGWHSLLACFAVGALTALAFAPTQYWFVLALALPALYMLLDYAPTRRAMIARSFAFGYGFFMAGTYWIAYALTVDAAQFGWLVPFSVVGLSAVMALWFVVFGALFWWSRSGDALVDLLRFAVLWVAVEYLRSLGMMGFAWNLLGYTALVSQRLTQLASITGVYGLSLLVMLVALAPVCWLQAKCSTRLRDMYAATVLITLIAAYGFGMARMPDAATLSDTRVRVVQPNIAQAMKWTKDGQAESLRIHTQLSQLRTDAPIPSTIIWSETALPFPLFPDSVWPSRINRLLPAGSTIITGAVRADDAGPDMRFWNSLVVIDAQGKLSHSYDKHQLVPFGEFVPLRRFLPMEKITPGNGDFSRGAGPQTLTVAGVPPFSPLVCYEVIFPWMAVQKTDRPDWILNVTNDAWYGDSPGPYQHLAMTRLRAIEQGLPVVRAANTGMSAVIDPFGRAIRDLPLNKRGIIDQALPTPLPPTPYATWGETLTLALLSLLWLFTFWRVRVRKG